MRKCILLCILAMGLLVAGFYIGRLEFQDKNPQPEAVIQVPLSEEAIENLLDSAIYGWMNTVYYGDTAYLAPYVSEAILRQQAVLLNSYEEQGITVFIQEYEVTNLLPDTDGNYQVYVNEHWLVDINGNQSDSYEQIRYVVSPELQIIKWEFLDYFKTEPVLQFSDLAMGFPAEFSMSSGVGAWSSLVTLFADGSFSGYYHDSDRGGITGLERYEAASSGQFANLQQIGEFEYRMTVENVATEHTPGTTQILDGVNVIYVESKFSQSSVWRLYAPGMPTENFSAEEWTTIYGFTAGLWGVNPPATLPYWVLFKDDGSASFVAVAE